MSYNYKGTRITGTSSIPTVFLSSGVPNAYVGQTYLNTSTGHVYRCYDRGSGPNAGKPSQARWEYVRTDVIFKPNGKVSSLATPKRGDNGSYVFTSTWKVPEAVTDAKRGGRATSLEVLRRLVARGTKTVKDKSGKSQTSAYTVRYDYTTTVSVSSTAASTNINSFPSKKPRTRASFWPLTKEKLVGVDIYVRTKNAKGTGAWVGISRVIGAPGKPTVATPTVDTDNWRVSCTITPYKDTTPNERYQTRYQVRVYDSSTKKWTVVQDGTTTTDNAFTRTYDVQSAQTVGRYTRVQFRAMSQGLAGDSAWSDWKEHVVGWPAKATISKVEMKSTAATAYGTAYIKTNTTVTAPVDYVKLQALIPGENDQDVTTKAAAIASLGWEDIDGSLDNGSCKALAFPISAVTAPQGKHPWIRVKSWHDKEDTFATYSDPVRLDALYVAAPPDPTAANDACAIISTASGADGQSAVVRFAWAKSGVVDDSDETEVSWSTDPDAWTSTDEPSTYTVVNSRGISGSVVYKNVTFTKSFTLTIRGLEEGEQVYVRCRRHMRSNDTYGPYSNIGKCMPSIAPSDVVLSGPSFVAAGQGATFSWGYAGGGTQRGWKLMTSAGKQIASGNDSMSACTVPASTVAERAVNGVLTCYVQVSTGGDYVSSGTVSVAISDAPEIGYGTVSELTAQPLSIPLVCDRQTASVAVSVIAQGSAGSAPYGDDIQAAGDTVWSDAVAPVWAWDETAQDYVATVVAPSGLAFKDGASYTIQAVATDTVTGLRSDVAEAEFSVAWAHQAPVPADGIAITPSVVNADDGSVTRKCAIAFAAPDDAASTDVYDLYRLTGDGAQLIGSDLSFTDVVEDAFAPFGEGTMHYRVATRTIDGDVAWKDYEYQLAGPVLRFDFGGDEHDYVELRWNIDASEAFAKDFEASKAMDGTQAGSWAPGVSHSARYSSDIIRLTEQTQVDAVRDLARCAKPVFVRTGFGTAFAANVDVDSLDMALMGGNGIAASFSARVIDLTDEFMLPIVPETDGYSGLEGA